MQRLVIVVLVFTLSIPLFAAGKKEQERIIAEVSAPMQQLAGAKRRGVAVKT